MQLKQLGERPGGPWGAALVPRPLPLPLPPSSRPLPRPPPKLPPPGLAVWQRLHLPLPAKSYNFSCVSRHIVDTPFFPPDGGYTPSHEPPLHSKQHKGCQWAACFHSTAQNDVRSAAGIREEKENAAFLALQVSRGKRKLWKGFIGPL